MNKYLVFRTDRLGDFLVSLILIKSIKRNDASSHISVVASENNYNYIKSFKDIDNTILLKKGFVNKIKLFFLLNKESYETIITCDNKNRSKIISFFLTSKKKYSNNKKNNISKINEIKEILKKLKFEFSNLDLNTLIDRNYNKNLINDYILIHFDEKWISKEYITSYTNIEPTIKDFNKFINILSNKLKKNIFISTGVKTPFFLKLFIKDNYNKKVKLIENSTFFELESIVHNASLIISCHGSISHIAAANNIPQIDIIDKSYDYDRWTDHFRNYKFVYRKNFLLLSNDIMKLL